MKFIILNLFLLQIFYGGCQQKKCKTIKPDKLVREIHAEKPENRLNIYVLPNFILINTIPVGKIKEGKLTDHSDSLVYQPLLEAIYDQFKIRGDDPYFYIYIYVHEKLPKSLIQLIQKTAVKTNLAPVILIPYDFTKNSCDPKQQKEQKTPQIKKHQDTILIRQEKSRILVGGKEVIKLENNRIPDKYLDKNGMVIIPLLKKISARMKKINKNKTPVLHITFDAKTDVTKYILITAGKAGIYKFKTIRVLP
ncbi:MAG: hypothetical protein ACQES9_11935 [Myxococcota bacterium]